MNEACVVCGGKEFREIYRDLRDKSYFVPGRFDILGCESCGVEFLFPLLNEKQLEKYYPKNYYSFKQKNKLNLAYHKLSALYSKNKLVKLLFFPFSPLFYTYYLGKSNKNKRILEIGCGDGLKLEIYKKYGWKTNGIEPYGGELNEREKKLGIRRESVKDVKFRDEFDLIILKEVLEHVPNQELILKKAYSWLNTGGKLIITVPNTESLWNRVFKENWFGYDVPRHLYNYSKKNLCFLLKKSGFKINKVRVYDSPYMLVGSLKFKSGKKSSFLYSNLTKILAVPISLIVSYLGRGSLIEVEAGK